MNEISSSNNVESVAAYQGEDQSLFYVVPNDIIKMIFSYLSEDLGRVAKVCLRWRETAYNVLQLKDKEALEKYGAFGAAEWKKYFGEVVEAPPIPRGIFAWFDGPSVKTEGPGGKRGETGLLFLMPAKVNGEDLSLNSMNEVAKNAIGAWQTKYIHYDLDVRHYYGKNSVGKSYWVWMSKALLLNSRNKTYEKQKSMVKDLGNGHELPKVLEAVVLNIIWYVSHAGERLFSNNPWTYIRCQESIGGQWPLIVGGFALGGLVIYYNGFDDDDYGVAACRKFRPLGFGK